MRITFLAPHLGRSGGCRVIAIYASKLRALGHEVTVVSRLPERPSWKRRLYDMLRGRPTPKLDPDRAIYFTDLGVEPVEVSRIDAKR